MMMDCGTTGGYAKIATVIGPDLGKIAQAKPQDKLRFIACSDEEAVQAVTDEQEKYLLIAGIVAKEIASEQAVIETNKTVPILRTSYRKLRVHISGRVYDVEIKEVN
jgi:hypothetical protein